MSWWWAGAVGAARKKIDDANDSSSAAAAAKFQSVGLIVTSAADSSAAASLAEILPLSDTPGGPWKVCTLFSPLTHSVEHLECGLSSITHIFLVDADVETTRYALSTVLPVAKGLQHVCLQTGRAHYLGHEPPFHEDLPRTESRNPCHLIEDALFDEVRKRGEVSWSVHRPGTIFGSTGLIKGLCVYAAICKKEGIPMRWPGNKAQWDGFSNASDADLVAEQQIWAAVDTYAKDEAFNCSNGDVFKWKHMWKVLAEQFGVEWVGYETEAGRFRLGEAMEGKGEVWEEIVKENELMPTKLWEVGNWGLLDEVFNTETCALDSMNKSKEHGFLGFRNSVYSFTYWIDKTKASKIVPADLSFLIQPRLERLRGCKTFLCLQPRQHQRHSKLMLPNVVALRKSFHSLSLRQEGPRGAQGGYSLQITYIFRGVQVYELKASRIQDDREIKGFESSMHSFEPIMDE